MKTEQGSWYQFLVVVLPLVGAIAAISYAYDWSEVIREDTQEFLYRFEPTVPEGYVVVSDPLEVSVTFRGSERARGALANETIRVIRPDEAINKTGEHVIQIPQPPKPAGLDVVGMVPAVASVEIDTLDAREVKVSAEVVGEVAPNHRVGTITVSPEVLTVRVPSRSESTAALSTLPVSVAGRDRTTTISDVGVDLPDLYSLPSSSRTTVSVTVEIVPIREQRLFDPIPIEIYDPPEGYTVSVHPAYIALQVDVPVDREPIGEVRAVINAARIARTSEGEIAEGFHSGYEVELTGLPADIEGAVARPEKVTLEVRKIVIASDDER